MAPSWNVKPCRTPLEDRWLAVRISLRLADHHTEHADSLSGPLGDCESSVYKAREGEKSRSEEEVIWSRFIEERGMKMRAAHMTTLQRPSASLFIALLITERALSAHMSHFHKWWSLGVAGVWSAWPFLWLKHMFRLPRSHNGADISSTADPHLLLRERKRANSRQHMLLL